MHVIRLRRPWKRTEGDTPEVVVDVPDVDASGTGCQSVSYRRRFNQPSGLQPATRVFLRVNQWVGRLESVTVNEVPMAIGEGSLDVEITSLLRQHNQVELRLASQPGELARLNGEVTLAIDDE